MQRRLINFFSYSAGVVLLATAIAKLISSFGSARILQNPDPILAISFQHIFGFVGVVELIIALVCFFSKRIGLQASLVAWLAASFLVYRIGLVLVGYHAMQLSGQSDGCAAYFSASGRHRHENHSGLPLDW